MGLRELSSFSGLGTNWLIFTKIGINCHLLKNNPLNQLKLPHFKGNGYISRPTLKGLLHEIAPDLSDKDLDAAVDEIDEDGSGKIEFEEFWELMAGETDWNFN